MEDLPEATPVTPLGATAVLLRADAKARRITNLIGLTEQHLEIWRELYERPELSRVLRPSPSSEKHPVTKNEELFVRSLVLHLYSAFRAMHEGLYTKPAGLKRDIAWFFSLPIPAEVWKMLKPFQDRDFVKFVEFAIDDGSLRT